MSDDLRIIRIEDKLDTVSDRLSSIDSTLSAQHAVLKEHIRRTENLENRMEPMEDHVTLEKHLVKFILMVVGTVAFIASIAEIASYYLK